MPLLTPNYLTVDPVTGAVGADFSGHVHASGLDLLAGTDSTPPSDRRIRWLSESNGALVADLVAYEDVPSNLRALSMQVDGDTPGQRLNTFVGSVASDGSSQGIGGGIGSGGYSVSVFANALNRLLLNDAGRSDWHTMGDSVTQGFAVASNAFPPNAFSGTQLFAKGGNYLITLAGSGYWNVGGVLKTLECYMDGNFIFQSQFFINTPNVHATFPTGSIVLNLSAGSHWFWARNTATTDVNDWHVITATPA